jgi:hypothetical protein
MEDMRIVQGMFVYRNDIVLLYRLSMYRTRRFCQDMLYGNFCFVCDKSNNVMEDTQIVQGRSVNRNDWRFCAKNLSIRYIGSLYCTILLRYTYLPWTICIYSITLRDLSQTKQKIPYNISCKNLSILHIESQWYNTIALRFTDLHWEIFSRICCMLCCDI